MRCRSVQRAKGRTERHLVSQSVRGLEFACLSSSLGIFSRHCVTLSSFEENIAKCVYISFLKFSRSFAYSDYLPTALPACRNANRK